MGVIQRVTVKHADGRESPGYFYHHDIGREGWEKIFGSADIAADGVLPILSMDAYKLAVSIIVNVKPKKET